MNFRKRMMASMLLVIMLCLMCVTSVVAEETTSVDSDGEQKVKILFTHDMHSHLDAYKSEESVMIGGLAKMKTLIDEKKAENPVTFLVDGGDFSMGTLYQTIYETDATELTMLGRLGYDVTTFGNHEFDYRSEGVSNMFHAALKNAEEDSSLQLPAFVCANIDWAKNTSEDNERIHQVLEDYGSTPYVIVEHGGVRIGVYGVLGEDAEDCAPESGLTFESIVDTSKELVDQLEKEDVDMIVCLSHSGTSEDEGKSEDELLAKEVPEIDVIISGHTHTKLEEPIQKGDTYIVSAGCYGENLGELDLIQKEDGRWELDEYQLNHLDDSVKEDEAITTELKKYKEKVDEEYLKQFGYTFDQVLAENNVEFTQRDDFAEELEEDPLGSIIADSYIYAVEKAEGAEYKPVDVAIAPSGVIRDTLQKGKVTVSDVFNISSLGIGADRIPGYPLVSVYLTGKELKTVAEIDVSVSPIMTAAQLYPSGMRWTYNPSRMILNRVIEVELSQNVPYTEEKQTEEIQDDKLYRVVAGLYSAQMLGTVEDTSKGLLKITPKDENGNKIEDFEDYIVHDQSGNEVKEWYALASYLESFEQNEKGISQIPSYYGEKEGRKLEDDSKNIIELVKQPNKFAFMLYALILIIVLIIVFVIRFIIKRRKKKKNMLY